MRTPSLASVVLSAPGIGMLGSVWIEVFGIGNSGGNGSRIKLKMPSWAT